MDPRKLRQRGIYGSGKMEDLPSILARCLQSVLKPCLMVMTGVGLWLQLRPPARKIIINVVFLTHSSSVLVNRIVLYRIELYCIVLKCGVC